MNQLLFQQMDNKKNQPACVLTYKKVAVDFSRGIKETYIAQDQYRYSPTLRSAKWSISCVFKKWEITEWHYFISLVYTLQNVLFCFVIYTKIKVNRKNIFQYIYHPYKGPNFDWCQTKLKIELESCRRRFRTYSGAFWIGAQKS